jgi:hypothetical protein
LSAVLALMPVDEKRCEVRLRYDGDDPIILDLDAVKDQPCEVISLLLLTPSWLVSTGWPIIGPTTHLNRLCSRDQAHYAPHQTCTPLSITNGRLEPVSPPQFSPHPVPG